MTHRPAVALPSIDAKDTDAVRHFIVANTRLSAPPLVPEIRLHLADQSVEIWQKTEDDLGQMNLPPPYWAFAWAGGQALARCLLDLPGQVAGKRVLDLGCGSGLVGIAAGRAGAASVLAADIDHIALVASDLNADTNGVTVTTTGHDMLSGLPAPIDVVLVGDLFYERQLAARVLALIEPLATAGACVLIGDPQRDYFPRGRFTQVAAYQVPVTRDLENAELKHTAVWRV